MASCPVRQVLEPISLSKYCWNGFVLVFLFFFFSYFFGLVLLLLLQALFGNPAVGGHRAAGKPQEFLTLISPACVLLAVTSLLLPNSSRLFLIISCSENPFFFFSSDKINASDHVVGKVANVLTVESAGICW